MLQQKIYEREFSLASLQGKNIIIPFICCFCVCSIPITPQSAAWGTISGMVSTDSQWHVKCPHGQYVSQ